MNSCDIAEFIEEEAVHTPLNGQDFPKFLIEIFHLPLDKSKSSLSIFENSIFRISILLLILLKNDAVDSLPKFPPIIFPENLNNFSGMNNLLRINMMSLILKGLIIFNDDLEQFINN